MRQLLRDSEPRNDVFAPIRPIGVTHVGATVGALGNDKRLDAGDRPAARAGTVRDRDAPAADLCDAHGGDFEAVLAVSVGEEFVA
jgi:hypothetical protein